MQFLGIRFHSCEQARQFTKMFRGDKPSLERNVILEELHDSCLRTAIWATKDVLLVCLCECHTKPRNFCGI